jgi:predicted glycoside hydrolase/deacetylase ChbG (UPF0249 family)
MNTITRITGIVILFFGLTLQAQEGPRLIIRGDDIGSTHGANLGCIQSYMEGILRSTEIMVPCPWFPEAVKMLQETPDLDVGCTTIDKQVAEVFEKLAGEYKLDIDPGEHQVRYFPTRIRGESTEERVAAFIEALRKLESGETYLFVEHPAVAGNEMEAVGHEGYYHVSNDRQMVQEMFTSPEIMLVIEELGIELISYADLVQ